MERIYTMYLSGMTVDVISRQLQSEHIVIPDKKFTFGKNMVMNILKNEKYCGDCILQKTVTIDCISKTRKGNLMPHAYLVAIMTVNDNPVPCDDWITAAVG